MSINSFIPKNTENSLKLEAIFTNEKPIKHSIDY